MNKDMRRIWAITLCLILTISSLAVPAGADTRSYSDSMTALEIAPLREPTGEDGPWKVTYYVGDALYDSEMVEDGHMAYGPSKGQPSDPSGEEKPFIGWYENSSNTPFDFDTTNVEGDLNLYASFSSTEGVVRFRDRFGSKHEVYQIQVCHRQRDKGRWHVGKECLFRAHRIHNHI